MQDIEFVQSYRYSAKLDVETGELVEVKCLGIVTDTTPTEVKEKKEKKKTTTPRKKKKDESDTPQLILEENKCSLNTSAVELLEVEPGDKLAIEYEKYKSGFRPVLTKSEKNGNKLTKSNTLACRGTKNEELAKFGTIFEVITHPSKPDAWILNGNSMPEEAEEDIDVNIPLEEDITEIVDNIDDEDLEITELDSDFFNID